MPMDLFRITVILVTVAFASLSVAHSIIESFASAASEWHLFIGTGEPVFITTCGGLTNFDTALALFAVNEACNLKCIAHGDDMTDGACSPRETSLLQPAGLASSVYHVTQPSQWYAVFVSGPRPFYYFGQPRTGIYSLSAIGGLLHLCDDGTYQRNCFASNAQDTQNTSTLPERGRRDDGDTDSTYSSSTCLEPSDVLEMRAGILSDQLQQEIVIGVPDAAADAVRASLLEKTANDAYEESVARQRLAQGYAERIAAAERAQYMTMQVEYQTELVTPSRPRDSSVPGLGYVGRGYDLLQGNPRDMTGKVDPGYRHAIVNHTYGAKRASADAAYPLPDLVDVTLEPSAILSASVSVITTAAAYQTQLDESMAFGASVKFGRMFSARFSHSSSYQQVRGGSVERSTTYVSTEGRVVAYRARLLTGVMSPESLTESFVAAVAALPVFDITEPIHSDDWLAYAQFHADFGSHYTSEVMMGGVAAQMYSMTAIELEKFLATVTDTDTSGGGSVKFSVFKASASVDFQSKLQSQGRAALSASQASQTEWFIGGDAGLGTIDDGSLQPLQMWAATVSSLPAPIGASLELVSDLLESTYFPNDSSIAQKKDLLMAFQCSMVGGGPTCQADVCDLDYSACGSESAYLRFGDFITIQSNYFTGNVNDDALDAAPFVLLKAPTPDVNEHTVVSFAYSAETASLAAAAATCAIPIGPGFTRLRGLDGTPVNITHRVLFQGRANEELIFGICDDGYQARQLFGQYLHSRVSRWPQNLLAAPVDNETVTGSINALAGFSMVGCAAASSNLIQVFGINGYVMLSCPLSGQIVECRLASPLIDYFANESIYRDALNETGGMTVTTVIPHVPDHVHFVFDNGTMEVVVQVNLFTFEGPAVTEETMEMRRSVTDATSMSTIISALRNGFNLHTYRRSDNGTETAAPTDIIVNAGFGLKDHAVVFMTLVYETTYNATDDVNGTNVSGRFNGTDGFNGTESSDWSEGVNGPDDVNQTGGNIIPWTETIFVNTVVFVNYETLEIVETINDFFVDTNANSIDNVHQLLKGDPSATWDDSSREYVFQIMSPVVDWNMEPRRPVRVGDVVYMSSNLGPIYFHNGNPLCEFMNGAAFTGCFMDNPISQGSQMRDAQFRLVDEDYFVDGVSGRYINKTAELVFQLTTDGVSGLIPEFGAPARRCMRSGPNPASYKDMEGQSLMYRTFEDVPMSQIASLAECSLFVRQVDESALFPTRYTYNFR